MAEIWGLPDWTDESAYPREMEECEWFWEFTRRRPAYREVWAEWYPIKRQRVMVDEAEDFRALALEQWGHEDISQFLITVPTDKPDWMRLNFRMSAVLDPRMPARAVHMLWSHFTDAVGLIQRRPFSKSHDLPDLVVKSMHDDLADRLAFENESGLATYYFDLGKPLEPQLRRASQTLRQEQEFRNGIINSRKPQTWKWADYLRALDGREAGAKYAEIADVIHDDQSERATQKGRDTFRNALQVRDNFPI